MAVSISHHASLPMTPLPLHPTAPDFRGERHCDGGLTNFIPLPPGTVGIRVCCFPSKQLSPVYRWGGRGGWNEGE